MAITLRQLRYFEALARYRHFGKAAQDCAVSQPALSVQIQEMEAQLGVTLVERHRSEIGLTEAGLEVARRARSILAEVQDLEDQARHRHRLMAGILRLGVIPSIAPYLLPSALPALQTHFPDLDLQIRETISETLIEELSDGKLDLLLLSLPLPQPIGKLPPTLKSAVLFEDGFVLAMPAAKMAAFDRPPSAADLNGLDLLLLEEGHCLREQALDYCNGPSAEGQSAGRRSLAAASLATITQMVANGYGATLLPEISLPREVRAGDAIAVMRFREPRPSRSIGLVWRRTTQREADFRSVGEIIAECGRRLIADGAPIARGARTGAVLS